MAPHSSLLRPAVTTTHCFWQSGRLQLCYIKYADEVNSESQSGPFPPHLLRNQLLASVNIVLVVNMVEICSAILCRKETSGDQISNSLIGLMMRIWGQMIMEFSFTLKNGLGSLVDGNHGPSGFKQSFYPNNHG